MKWSLIMMIKNILKICILCFLLPGLAFAIPIEAYEQYKLGMKQFRSKEYRKAKEIFINLSEKYSYADAQLNLGIMEQKGFISKPNYIVAREWFLKAAKQGQADAQNRYAALLDRGIGGEKDPAQAAEWRKISASLGHKTSQYDLGVMYFYGKGVEQDLERAATLFIKSADQGYEYSKNRLYAIKRMLLSLKDQGDPVAYYLLGTFYRKGFGGLRQEDKKAFEYYSFAADKGLANGQYELAQLYFYGRNVKKNHNMAAKLYKKAADQGHIFAMKKLAVMHLNRQGGLSDKSPEIVTLLEKSAAAGHQYSLKKLGYMYLTGDMVKQDKAKAFKLLLSAAQQGDLFSQKALGKVYMKGDGVAKDMQEAAYWLTLAAENNDKEAKKLIKEINK